MELTRCGIHPLQQYPKRDGSIPTPWGANCWSVFINDVEQLLASIRYVEHHPEKEALARQHYEFITPFTV